MTKNKGEFNLDFEETVLLLGKVNRMKKLFSIIYEIARRILNLCDYLPETTKDGLKEIRDKANEGRNE